MYISIVPAAVMALLGLAAVMTVLKAGSSSPETRLTLMVLAAAAVVVMGVAVYGADMVTQRERRRSGYPAADSEESRRRFGELAYVVSRGRQELQGLVRRIAAGETPARRDVGTRADGTGDPFVYLARELQEAHNEAWNAVIDAANAAPSGTPTQRVEVFVNLARRMQSLSHRAIQGLDELENQVEDPDLLKGLFKVDHLSTRIRRQAESLALIGGAASRRQWSRPVTMYEVLRSAIAEVEQYNRVKVAPPVEGTLVGGAVADIIHLLAELVENATKFAPPHSQVMLRAEPVTAGLVIEIEDRGLGIPRESQHRLNELLADLERIDIDELLQDGRIGLLVVSALARRHNVAVKLQTNLYGGTQAVVVIPKELIGSEQKETNPQAAASLESAEPVAAVSAAMPSGFSSPADLSEPGHGAVQTSADVGAGESPAPRSWREQDAGPSAPQTDRRSDRLEGNGKRPALPRRRAQANLAPELLTPPTPRDDSDAEHNHGLMAAFQKGMRASQQEDPADEAGGAG